MFQEPKTEEQLRKIIEIHSTIVWPSRFQFLKEINGIRIGCVTTILAQTGAGKTTLCAAIQQDCLQSEFSGLDRILHYSTEETVGEFQIKLKSCGIKDFSKYKFSHDSQKPKSIKNLNDFLNYFETVVTSSGCKIVFLDNITTQEQYQEASPSMQGKFLTGLRKIAKSNKVAIVLFSHTKAEFDSRRLMKTEDVRGSKQLGNISEYFFALQTIHISGKKRSYVRILKSRHISIENMNFALIFRNGAFEKDTSIDFDALKQFYKLQDIL